MNKIEELIEKLCPGGVEYRELGEVISALRTGLNPRQNFKLNSPDAKHYYITVRELVGFSIQVTGKTDRVNSVGLRLIQNRSKIQLGDILFSGTGTIGRTALVTEAPNNWNIKEGIYVITPIVDLINARFLIYLIHSSQIYNQILAKADGSTVASISMASLRKISIPFPPLPIQQEIVNILDSFTRLEAELEAELEARKKQYEYYRNDLLNFEGKEVEWRTMGEIVNIKRGVRVVRNQLFENGKYPVYQNSMKPLGYFEKYNYNANTTFIISAGAAGDVGFSDVDFWAADDCFLCICPDYLKSKFLYYVLLCNQTYLYSRVRRASVPRLSRDAIAKIQIPIPPLSEQERIVTILDKFDALVNDISIGLPAEIQARRKQYEYYRGKLLDFKNVNAVNE